MFESVEKVFNVATDTCVSLFSLISYTVSFSFNLSFVIGQLIVKFAVGLVSLLVDCVYTLQQLLQVLSEDYFVFLSDIKDNLSFLAKSLFDFGESVIHTIFSGLLILRHISLSFLGSIVSIVVGALYLVESIFCTFHHCLVLFKNSLILVGLTSWELLVFFPNSITSLKRALVSFAVQSMANIRDALNFVRLKSHRGVSEAFLFVSDIPKESLYGLLACCVLSFVLVKYHQSLRPLFVRNIIFTLSQCQITLMTVWNYLEAFTLWLLTNQMTPSLNGARYFAAEGDGNLPPNVNNQAEADETSDEDHDGNGAEGLHPEQFQRKDHHEPEERLCVVCQDRERCTIILPCRHVCLCYECCGMIRRTHGRCPICRHVVRRTMRVYIN